MQLLTITIESNALVGDAWSSEIAELLHLAETCPEIDVRRTAGTLRESSRPAGNAQAAERRRLAMSVQPLAEAFTIGASEIGSDESCLAENDEPAEMEALSLALWDRLPAEISGSRLEDVVHLHTHWRHRRDRFVTTDRRMHDRRHELTKLHVRVAMPVTALNEAIQRCK